MTPDIETAIRAVAPKFGVSFARVAAVVEVESRGKPFEEFSLFKGSKTPRFLFERHVFYRKLPAVSRNKAVQLGLANREWQRKTQYADQRSSQDRISLMFKVIEFSDAETAFLSASWGLMQVMGFNYKACGESSAVNLVKSFSSIEGQIEGAMNFIEYEGLMKFLKNRRWADFAEGYNGSGYRANKYDDKLAAAYEKYK